MGDIENIDLETKERYRQLTQHLGHVPTFAEQLDLSAWYKQQHQTLIEQRGAATKRVEWQERVKERGERVCDECGGVIEPTGQRGRPRRWHEGCRPEDAYKYPKTEEIEDGS